MPSEGRMGKYQNSNVVHLLSVTGSEFSYGGNLRKFYFHRNFNDPLTQPGAVAQDATVSPLAGLEECIQVL